MAKKQRLDELVVALGLVDTRSKAKAMIMAGQVRVNGQVRSKAGDLIVDGALVEIAEKNPYVSRGGLKLKGAINHFGATWLGIATDAVALDVGASTGGFTDCLLQFGVARVYAIDVGKGQLDWKLRNDKRVVLFEEENIRHFDPARIPEKVDLVVIDVSFISILKFIKTLPQFMKPDAKIVAMVKPQFEGEPSDVEKGGIVRNVETRERILDNWKKSAGDMGFTVVGECLSPLTGTDGNQEVFVVLTPS